MVAAKKTTKKISKKVSKKVSKNKTKRKVAGKSAHKKKLPGWITLLSGMLIGLIIAVIGYINDWVPKPDSKKPIAQTIQTKSTPKIEDKSTDLQIEPKKDYDFYETLQDMEVIIDEDLTQAEDSRHSKKYILQLGSFQNKADAEALKAQIAFIGLTAFLQSVEVKQTLWHRVRIGPYESGRKADIVLKNLKSNGFSPIILREK